MSVYLAVWNSPTAISDGEAATRYFVLTSEKSAEREFDGRVYTFYCGLTSLYPEVEMVPEDDLGSYPWACGIDISGDHVVMAIQPEQFETVMPQVVTLAEQYELVCFDPQAGKVHLPPHLRTAKAATAGAVCRSGPEPISPSDMQITDVFELQRVTREQEKK